MGRLVGKRVGTSVGNGEGERVGEDVGNFDGAEVGNAVGEDDGDKEGADDGEVVGEEVGDDVVGEAVGPLVGGVPRSTAAKKSPISFDSSPTWSRFSYPSLPFPPFPQHLTSLLSNRAHVCSLPRAICCAVLPVPRSIGGKKSPISFGPSPRLSVSS